MVETMKKRVVGPVEYLLAALRDAIGRVPSDFTFGIEPPENPVHGDYASNVALKLAPSIRRAPITIARELAERLRNDTRLGNVVERIDVVAPGFLNFRLKPLWLQEEVAGMVGEFVQSVQHPADGKKKRRILIEFISANPTGPLTIANGRGGFLGDCLANVLDADGAAVTREYYVNDAGEQVRKLGWAVLKSVGYATPYRDEDLYRGEYVRTLARTLVIPAAIKKDAVEPNQQLAEHVARAATRAMLADIKRVVRKAGIRFDSWFSERSLYRQGFVKETLATLKRKRLVREHDGAQWLQVAELRKTEANEGDKEKEKVLIKSNGDATYLLPDLAYHREKFQRRKFSQVLDIVGADHHGYLQVLSAGLRALRVPEPEVVIVQFVRLVEDGREVKMSKRSGSFVTLEELLDEVGSDAARWFFLSRAPETHMDFDLALAKEQSDRNPVHYVQYAHARCASILRSASPRTKRKDSMKDIALQHPSEISLMKTLVQFPDMLARTARTRHVHQLPVYATSVATAFSAFYRDCRVLGEEAALQDARLQLVEATKAVLARTLGLMGIRAPEKM